MGDYIPQAPVNDEAKKHNENLPGQGGIFNTVNLQVYHYAGNNPIKYTDPDGKIAGPVVFAATVGVVALCVGLAAYMQTGSYQEGVQALSESVQSGMSLAGNVLRTGVNALAKAIASAQSKNNQNLPQITIQIQENTKGLKNDTLGTSHGIYGDPKTGVTKTQALGGLELAIADLQTNNKSMANSPDFQRAAGEMRKDILTRGPVESRRTALQESFTYKGKNYRIDLDSYDHGNSIQNLSVE